MGRRELEEAEALEAEARALELELELGELEAREVSDYDRALEYVGPGRELKACGCCGVETAIGVELELCDACDEHGCTVGGACRSPLAQPHPYREP